jgi:hypothetical protein
MSLVSSPCFKEGFLDQRALKLADSLLAELHIFIRTKGRDSIANRVRSQLKSVFQSALEVKIHTIIGKDLFEAIWPAPQTTFDAVSMTTQSDLKTSGILEHLPRKVKLCLAPGLRVYTYDRKTVDYSSFTKGDERDLGKPGMVFQALVAIE